MKLLKIPNLISPICELIEKILEMSFCALAGKEANRNYLNLVKARRKT
ncbi:MAG: hypothetical protein JWQ09_2930 [Segetibacter sp.]|nr:hypothetical protein [Segetibacter sp.]